MNKTGIKWTQYTFNLWSGCLPRGKECDFCYAKTVAERFGGKAFPNGFDLTFRPDSKLRELVRLGKKTGERYLVFMDSMSDFFLEDKEFELPDGTMDAKRDLVWEVMSSTPHIYQILTKRENQMQAYCRTRTVPENVWIGVTAGTRQASLKRIPALQQVAASVRFVSAEPLLEDITPTLRQMSLDGIHQIIVGGESGDHLQDESLRQERALADYQDKQWIPRPDRLSWVTGIRDLCQERGIAFFFKQWGGKQPHSAGDLLDGDRYQEFPIDI